MVIGPGEVQLPSQPPGLELVSWLLQQRHCRDSAAALGLAAGWERVAAWAQWRATMAVAAALGGATAAAEPGARAACPVLAHPAGGENNPDTRTSCTEAAPEADWLPTELTTLLHIPLSAAYRLTATADSLRCGATPVLAAAWQSGAVTRGHAEVITSALADLTPAHRGPAENSLTSYACGNSVARLRQHVPGVLAALCPSTAEAADAVEAEQRGLWLRRPLNAAPYLVAQLPEISLREVLAGLDRLSEPGVGEDHRSRAQRRADALVELTGRDHDHPGGGAVAPHIGVVVPLATLAGRSETPGMLPDGTPVSSSLAREKACGAAWTALYTDAEGRLLDLGRTTRVPNRAQQIYLRVRDGSCQFPGCGVEASRCVIHHVTWWRHDGRTDRSNLICLCLPHHTAIHRGGWQLAPDLAGGWRWTSPRGHTHHVTGGRLPSAVVPLPAVAVRLPRSQRKAAARAQARGQRSATAQRHPLGWDEECRLLFPRHPGPRRTEPPAPAPHDCGPPPF